MTAPGPLAAVLLLLLMTFGAAPAVGDETFRHGLLALEETA